MGAQEAQPIQKKPVLDSLKEAFLPKRRLDKPRGRLPDKTPYQGAVSASEFKEALKNPMLEKALDYILSGSTEAMSLADPGEKIDLDTFTVRFFQEAQATHFLGKLGIKSPR